VLLQQESNHGFAIFQLLDQIFYFLFFFKREYGYKIKQVFDSAK